MSTNCVFPPELEEKQLMAYLDDPDVNQDIARHLKQCPHCSEKAKSLKDLQGRLTKRLYRSTCPSSTELGEFHLKLLPAAQRLIIGQHARRCMHCQRELSVLEDYLAEFEPQRNVLESVQEFFAQLVHPMKLASERGTGNKLLTYELDNLFFSIDVAGVKEQPGRRTILGLVDGLGLSGFTMEAYLEGNLIATTLVDEFNTFVFSHLAPGNYDLALVGLQTKISLTPSVSVL